MHHAAPTTSLLCSLWLQASHQRGTPVWDLTPAPASLWQTGKHCRVVPVGSLQQIKCDMDIPDQATPLVFTGDGFTYQDQPITNPGGNQPLYIGGPGTPGTVIPAGMVLHC